MISVDRRVVTSSDMMDIDSNEFSTGQRKGRRVNVSSGSSKRASTNRLLRDVVRWSILALAVGAASVVAQPSWAASRSAALTVSAACPSSAINITVSTDRSRYGPGALVKVTALIRNTSARACTVALGPSSPMFSVRSLRGVTVWNSCGVKSGLAACPQFLVLRRLAPGVALRLDATWNQRSGAPLRRVATGAYRASARLASVNGESSTFQIVGASTARTILVTQALSGGHYVLQRGDQLIVRLASPSLYTWSAPTSSNEVVLHRSGATSGPSATATFTARAVGRTEVTAVDNPTCYPQCLPPSRLFVITVRVAV